MRTRFEPVWAFGRAVLYPLLRLLRWRIVGTEHIPEHGAVLLASNHISFVDELALLWLGDRRHRRVRFMAKADLWKVRGLRFFLLRTKQIPVDRSSPLAAGSLVTAVRMLKSGEAICIFPEGRISDDLEPMAAKTGAARLAGISGAPIVPVGIWGTQRIYPKGRKPRWRPGLAISIAVGEPIEVGPDEDAFDATDRVMGAIVDCVATARSIYPQRPRRGDDGWWVRTPETAQLRPTPRASRSAAS